MLKTMPLTTSLLLLLFLLHLHLHPTSPAPPPPPAQPRFACQPPYRTFLPFCNASLPIPLRARSIVSLLSIEEKTELLSNTAASVPRLGIPPYEWWSESLHGVSTNGPGVIFGHPIPAATGFPQVILLAASFNRTLWSRVARAIAVEARAMHNCGQAGLTFWAPNVNVFRDPRWGRGQETPGEDPVVVSEYAVAYVLALQGKDGSDQGLIEGVVKDSEENSRALQQGGGRDDGSGRLMLSACCKHYTAYDLEKWGNFTRYTFNAKVTEQDMEDTYQPPFRSCVQEGHASCLMCSYNELNGVPLCADHDLLQKARDEWGFQGYITSDCNAVATIFEYQNYTTTAVDAVALALKAGVDINCGGYYSLYAKSALESGKIQEEDIDRALVNLFYVQLRLGLFDEGFAEHQFGRFGPGDVCTAEHRQLALEAAREGIVLLKNDRGFLPLSRRNALLGDAINITSMAVIGPMANNASKLGGDYTGVSCLEKSLVDALQTRIPNISFAAGCTDGVRCSSVDGFPEAVQKAAEAEVVVLVVGLDLTQEDEDLDRISLLLPGKQAELVVAVAKASSRPVVLVLVGGGPVDVSFVKEDPSIGSILWVGYPGEAGAQAVAEAVLGDFNPGGRLPMTWYPESFTAVPMDDMHMRPDPSRGYPGRTYRFYTGPIVYNFGHGLSYTNYSHEFLSAPNSISLLAADVVHHKSLELDDLDRIAIHQLAGLCEALSFTVRISVRNDGVVDGSHALLLFSQAKTRLKGAPQKQLVGFERVHVVAGQSTEVAVPVEPCTRLSTADEKGERVLPLGRHVLMLESGAEHTLIIEI